jgi:hypothetical protein
VSEFDNLKNEAEQFGEKEGKQELQNKFGIGSQQGQQDQGQGSQGYSQDGQDQGQGGGDQQSGY